MKKIQIFSSWFFITLNIWLSGVNVVLFTLNLEWNTLNSPQLTLWVQGQSLFSFDHLMIIIFIVGLTWPITTITIVIINFFNRGADDLLKVTASKQRSPTYVLQPALHLPPFTFYLLPFTLHITPFPFYLLPIWLFLFIIIVIIAEDSIAVDQLYKSKSTPFASALIFVILISDCVICVICVAWPNFVFVLFCSLYNWWSVIVMASPLSFCILFFLSFGNFILFFIFS